MDFGGFFFGAIFLKLPFLRLKISASKRKVQFENEKLNPAHNQLLHGREETEEGGRGGREKKGGLKQKKNLYVFFLFAWIPASVSLMMAAASLARRKGNTWLQQRALTPNYQEKEKQIFDIKK